MVLGCNPLASLIYLGMCDGKISQCKKDCVSLSLFIGRSKKFNHTQT